MRSVAAFASGIALGAIGLGTVVAGGIFYAIGSNAAVCDCDGCECGGDGSDDKVRGGVLMTVGGGLTAVGVPLIVIGAQREAPASPRAAELLVGSRGASLRWRF